MAWSKSMILIPTLKRSFTGPCSSHFNFIVNSLNSAQDCNTALCGKWSHTLSYTHEADALEILENECRVATKLRELKCYSRGTLTHIPHCQRNVLLAMLVPQFCLLISSIALRITDPLAWVGLNQGLGKGMVAEMGYDSYPPCLLESIFIAASLNVRETGGQYCG